MLQLVPGLRQRLRERRSPGCRTIQPKISVEAATAPSCAAARAWFRIRSGARPASAFADRGGQDERARSGGRRSARAPSSRPRRARTCRSRCARRRGRRRARRRGARTRQARARSTPASSSCATGRRRPDSRSPRTTVAAPTIDASARRSCIGSFAAGSLRFTSGRTARASTSRAGPRRSGVLDARSAEPLGRGRDLDATVLAPDRTRPRGRALHEHAVCERHPAEPDLLFPAHTAERSRADARNACWRSPAAAGPPAERLPVHRRHRHDLADRGREEDLVGGQDALERERALLGLVSGGMREVEEDRACDAGEHGQRERGREQPPAFPPPHVGGRRLEHGAVVADEQGVVGASRRRLVLRRHVLRIARRLRAREHARGPGDDGEPQAARPALLEVGRDRACGGCEGHAGPVQAQAEVAGARCIDDERGEARTLLAVGIGEAHAHGRRAQPLDVVARAGTARRRRRARSRTPHGRAEAPRRRRGTRARRQGRGHARRPRWRERSRRRQQRSRLHPGLLDLAGRIGVPHDAASDPEVDLAVGDRERADGEREIEVAVRVHAARATPIDAPRPTGSSSAMSSSALLFGQPVMEPPGSVASSSFVSPTSSRSSPSTVATRCDTPASWRSTSISGQRTLPTAHTRERSLRSRSTIMTCSAASFADSIGTPAARVPLIGDVRTRPSALLQHELGRGGDDRPAVADERMRLERAQRSERGSERGWVALELGPEMLHEVHLVHVALVDRVADGLDRGRVLALAPGGAPLADRERAARGLCSLERVGDRRKPARLRRRRRAGAVGDEDARDVVVLRGERGLELREGRELDRQARHRLRCRLQRARVLPRVRLLCSTPTSECTLTREARCARRGAASRARARGRRPECARPPNG